MRKTDVAGLPSTIDSRWRIGIVCSSYYKEEIDALAAGARDLLVAAGIPAAQIFRHDAPGSFEVPLIGAALAEAKKVDALIGLGIIVEGETEHARLLAEQAARGIMDVQLLYRIPFAFEILYVRDLQDAQARAQGDANKGREAARAVLYSLAEIRRIAS